MHPMNKTRIFKEFFVLCYWRREHRNMLPFPLIGMGSCMSSTLYIQDLSLSLDGVENPDKNGTQGELTSKKVAKYDNDVGSKLDQKYRSKGDKKGSE